SAICWSVASMFEVTVVVIDCTDTGAPPPTITPTTSIWRVERRGASGCAGSSGIPSDTAVTTTPPRWCSSDADRVDDPRVEQQQRQPDEHRDYSVGERHDLQQVH